MTTSIRGLLRVPRTLELKDVELYRPGTLTVVYHCPQAGRIMAIQPSNTATVVYEVSVEALEGAFDPRGPAFGYGSGLLIYERLQELGWAIAPDPRQTLLSRPAGTLLVGPAPLGLELAGALLIQLSLRQYRKTVERKAFYEPYKIDRGASPTERADVVLCAYRDGTAELVKSTDPQLWAICR